MTEVDGPLPVSARAAVCQRFGWVCYFWPVQDAKKIVRALLERLPDDCCLEEVLCHLYVIQKVEAGLVDADAGKVIPHEQVAEELRHKWVKGAPLTSSRYPGGSS